MIAMQLLSFCPLDYSFPGCFRNDDLIILFFTVFCWLSIMRPVSHWSLLLLSVSFFYTNWVSILPLTGRNSIQFSNLIMFSTSHAFSSLKTHENSLIVLFFISHSLYNTVTSACIISCWYFSHVIVFKGRQTPWRYVHCLLLLFFSTEKWIIYLWISCPVSVVCNSITLSLVLTDIWHEVWRNVCLKFAINLVN